MMTSIKQHAAVCGQRFAVEVFRRTTEETTAPRLLTVCYNTSAEAVAMTRACIESIQKYTPKPYELWVVDNASPEEHIQWLREFEGVNVILNRTPPVPKENQGMRARLGLRKVSSKEQMSVGSYANAVGLSLGTWAIETEVEQVFVMHNDILVLRDDWLAYLQSKLLGQVKAVAVRSDRHKKRINALHVSGMLFDYQLYQQLEMSFLPDIPRLDVGDRISDILWANNYETAVCPNTYNEPDLVDSLAEDDPAKGLPYTTRTFNDDRQVFFVHLARGTPKTAGTYWKEDRTTPADWLIFARDIVLAD